MTRFHDNILAVFDSASEEQLNQGKEWYADVKFEVRRDVSVNFVEPVLASMAIASPQQDWDVVKQVVTDYWVDGKPLTRILNHAKEKIESIKAGSYWPNYVRGPKTRSFCDNLISPNSSLAVTVDRHAVAIPYVGLEPHTGKRKLKWEQAKEQNLSQPAVYERVAQYYRDVAAEIDFLPLQVQAVTWIVWKENGGEWGW